MKVYVLKINWPYDGYDVEGVYCSSAAALKAAADTCKMFLTDWEDSYMSDVIEYLDGSFECPDCFTIQPLTVLGM